MTQTLTLPTTKQISQVIPLRKSLQKFWLDAQAYVSVSPQTIIIKKVQPASLSEIRSKLKAVSSLISKKDIKNAVQFARV